MEPRPVPVSYSHPDTSAAWPSVVVIATTFPARSGDGTPEFVLTLSRAIPRYDVTVVAPRMPGAPDDEVIDGVRVRRIAYFPRRWEGLAADAIMPTLRAEKWRIIEVPFLFGAMSLAAFREVRRQRAAVINPHWILPGGLIALLLRGLCRVPYVVTVHGADAYTLRSGIGAWLKRRVLRNAAAVLPVSSDIARTLGIEDAPVLRMGVDSAAVRAAVGDRHPEDGLLVYIGRLADKKGVDVLLDAVAALPAARLEILGDGPDRGALEARAARLGLDRRVHFRGRQPSSEVLAALARAQVVVIPSRVGSDGDMEGTPVVLCEAMAAGVPVVASDLGGLGECIVDGTTGLLVAPDDAAALTVALEKVLTDAVDLAAIGRAAADEASRTLDIGTVGVVYASVFDDVVQRR